MNVVMYYIHCIITIQCLVILMIYDLHLIVQIFELYQYTVSNVKKA